jgi:hypothetical protein
MIVKSSPRWNEKVSRDSRESRWSTSYLLSLAGICPPLSPTATEPDNPAFLKAMTDLHPKWRTLVGYLDIRNYSFSHHDLHGEFASTGFMFDCTHYAYTPFLMEPIWIALEDYFSKFSLNQFLETPPLKIQ